MDKGASAPQTGPSQVEPVPVSPLRASVPSAEAVASGLSEMQCNALLAMPFRSRRCGFAPGTLVSLCNTQNLFLTKDPCPQLAISQQYGAGLRNYFRTPFGDLVAQAIEARRAETQSGSVHESAVRQDAPEPPQVQP